MRNKRLEQIFPDITGIGIDSKYVKGILEKQGKEGSIARAEVVNRVLNNTEMLIKIAKNPDIVRTDPKAK